MKKIIGKITIFLTLLLSVSMYVYAANSEQEELGSVTKSGSCGENVVWELYSSNTLVISGEGEMNDYAGSSELPWSSDRTNIQNVIVGEGVTYIGDNAFTFMGIVSVSFPKTLKEIGSEAFEYCNNLQEVDLSETQLEIMGDAVFWGCSSLVKAILPDTLTIIPKKAFEGCEKLENVVLSANLTTINEYAFYDCESLLKIDLPDTIYRIDDRAFSNCVSLKEINLPPAEKSISLGEYAFSGCSALTSLEIKNPIKVEKCAFFGCLNLEVKLDYYGFNTVRTTLYEDAFTNVKDLQVNVIEGSSVIFDYSFQDCTSLTKVSFPDSIEGIGQYAFSGCTNWEQGIAIGEDVKVYDYAFNRCYKLTVDYTYGENSLWGKSSFWGCNLNLTIAPTKKNIGDYEFNEYSLDIKTLKISEGVEGIGRGNFVSAKITELVIPKTVKSIGFGAFDNCEELEKLVIKNPETKIYMNLSTLSLLTIYGYSNSTAESYAQNYNLPFYSIGVWRTFTIEYNGNGQTSGSMDDQSIKYCSDDNEIPTVNDNLFEKEDYKFVGWNTKADGTGINYEEQMSVEDIECENEDKIVLYAIWKKHDWNMPVSYDETNHWYECKNCGIKKDVANHSLGEWMVEQEPSYTAEGLKRRTCNACAYSEAQILNRVNVTSVALNSNKLDCLVGDSKKLIAICTPIEPTTNDVLWASSDERVVIIDKNGNITAVGEGIAIITATVGEYSAECEVMVTLGQWLKDGVGWWYRYADGSYPRNCWKNINGEDYYFNASGYMVANAWVGDYYVGADGRCLKNAWVGDYYVGADGRYLKNAWVGNYYVGANGAYVRGWLYCDGGWYYLGTDGAKQTGWIMNGETWYYADSTGRLYEARWLDDTYYFHSGGAMATGWLKLEGSWYYLGLNGVKQTGWINCGGTWYYGEPMTGRLYEEEWLNDTFYLLRGGAMATGWTLINGDYFYFDGNGAKVTNTWIGNYYLKDDGRMASNEWIGGYYVGTDGAWIPGYTG